MSRYIHELPDWPDFIGIGTVSPNPWRHSVTSKAASSAAWKGSAFPCGRKPS